MQQTISRDEKMKQISETAQKMKSGEISVAKSFDSVESFIANAKKA